MIEKISKSIKKNRKNLILFFIIWILLSLLIIAPISYCIVQASSGGAFNFQYLINNLTTLMANPINLIFGAFSGACIGTYFSTLIKFTLVYIIVVAIGIIRTAPKHEYTDIEHGSSDWCVGGEEYQVLNKNKGIILAQNEYLPVDKRGNVNVLVVGGSGSGKSASYSIPNAYQMLGSYVFTDPKGELFDKTSGFLKAHGYDIKILNLVKPQNSDGFNPLLHITSELDVDIIANTIVKGQSDTQSQSSDPYWDDMAEMLLKALIYYLLATRPEEEQNLASCAELVRAANSNGGGNLLTELMNQLPYDHPARMNYKSIEIAPEKTYGSILSSLQSKLGKFDSKEIAELTSTNTISFEEIGKKKTAVYVISSDTHAAYDFLLTIFFAQMIQRMYDFADNNGGALPMPTYFILDEFANIGRVPDFDKKISTSRSRKISFSVILQNLDQLEAVYEKSYETIMGNCDTHVFLGSNSFKTVEYFSKALGEKTISRDSMSVSRDKHMWRQGYNESDQVMARALLTPDELRRLDNDTCIVYEKGIKPIKAKKYYYFENSTMLKKLKEDIMNHNTVPPVERGKWRKYNPYNPYVEDDDGKQVEDLKVESLDDLFAEASKPKEEPILNAVSEQRPTQQPEETPIISEIKQEAPMLPQDEEETEVDIQKELEAKFDELFGAMDDSN